MSETHTRLGNTLTRQESTLSSFASRKAVRGDPLPPKNGLILFQPKGVLGATAVLGWAGLSRPRQARIIGFVLTVIARQLGCTVLLLGAVNLPQQKPNHTASAVAESERSAEESNSSRRGTCTARAPSSIFQSLGPAPPCCCSPADPPPHGLQFASLSLLRHPSATQHHVRARSTAAAAERTAARLTSSLGRHARGHQPQHQARPSRSRHRESFPLLPPA